MLIRREGQRGIAVIWLSVSIVALLLLMGSALSLVLYFANLSAVQYLADAAAVGAAAELDGTLNGWLRAKRVASSIVGETHLKGVPSGTGVLRFTEGGMDPAESEEALAGSKGDWGGLRVTIERGAYWNDPASPRGLSFASFESDAPEVTKESPPSANLKFGVPVHLIANAVKVSIEIAATDGPFNFVPGITLFRGGARTSISVRDSTLDECVLPAALPACALMLQMDPTRSDRYNSDRYLSSHQCPRELTITEANPRGLDTEAFRGDGITRSESYPRLPVWEGEINLRGVPLYGALGTVTEDGQSKAATPAQVLAHIGEPGGCKRVRLGSRFSPMHDAVGPTGLFSDTYRENFTAALRALINGSPIRFWEAFGRDVGGETPELNYPFLNREPRTHELAFIWPSTLGNRRIFMARPKEHWHYTNPLCHDYGGNYKSLTAGVPANNPMAGAREVALMVVAPTNVDPATGAGAYCDFQSLFTHAEQSTAPLVAGTAPVVVGFVRAFLFDFNVSRLPEGTVNEELDRNPNIFADVVEEDIGYSEETAEWAGCSKNMAACEAASDCLSPGVPPGCTNKPCTPCGGVKDKENYFECFYTSDEALDPERCRATWDDKYCQIPGVPDRAASQSRPGMHCLPK